MKRYYYGTVITKKAGMGVLGKFIKLYIDFGDDIRCFDNAFWVLNKFIIGSKVKWCWSWNDPRRTDNLILIKR